MLLSLGVGIALGKKLFELWNPPLKSFEILKGTVEIVDVDRAVQNKDIR